MRDTAKEIFVALSEALPPEGEVRDELIALGLLTTAVISHADLVDRDELVETFCATLRRGLSGGLN